MRPVGVLEASLYVDDLAAAESFYGDVLGLEFHSRQVARHVFFRCGSTMVLLFCPTETDDDDEQVPPHGSHGPGHLCFSVESAQLPAWREQLGRHSVPIEQEIDWPHGGYSIYFRDPAGNSLELATPQLWATQ